MATATSTDFSKYIKGVDDKKDCYDTKGIAYNGDSNIDKPIMTEDEFKNFLNNYYELLLRTVVVGGGKDYITNFLDSTEVSLKSDTNVTNLKDNEALLMLMKEFNDTLKLTSKNGFKEIDCNIKVSADSNKQKLYNALAKRVNASGILNKGKNKHFKDIISSPWKDCIKDESLLTQTGLKVLHIPTKDQVSKNTWSGVQAAVNSGNIYGMPAMSIYSYGRPISGGTDFIPKTTPKLSNDVSKILKSLLSNLKSKNIELDATDMDTLNIKLKTFNEMEKYLLETSVTLAGFNKSANAPDFNEEGSINLNDMNRLNREYESKMGRYTKMQRNFQDVIFAILQNCA